MTLDVVGCANGLDEPTCKGGRRRCQETTLPTCTIANSSPPNLASSVIYHAQQQIIEETRYLLQQIIADRMTEKIVDTLEVIEIEAEVQRSDRYASRAVAPPEAARGIASDWGGSSRDRGAPYEKFELEHFATQ